MYCNRIHAVTLEFCIELSYDKYNNAKIRKLIDDFSRQDFAWLDAETMKVLNSYAHRLEGA